MIEEMIEKTYPDELAKIFQGDDHTVGDLVCDSWEVDKLIAKDKFFNLGVFVSGFLKSLMQACMCVYVCVCVYAPKAINNWWCDFDLS